MSKHNPFSLTSKVAMTLAGTLFMLSATNVIAAPQLSQEPLSPIECFGKWRVTGADYNGNPVDDTRFGYVYYQGCGIFGEGHSFYSCHKTRGTNGRIVTWHNLNSNYDNCPEVAQVYNLPYHNDEFFLVTIEQINP